MKKYLVVFSILLLTLMLSCRPSGVVVKERPVAPVVIKPVQPYPNYIWIEGGWVRTGNHYTYRQGYWAPPRHRTYRPGYWKHTRGGWIWIAGRW